MEPSKKDLKLATFEVLKFLISRDVKDSHPLNIYPISFTNEVSNEDKSKDSNLEQNINIHFILVTNDVLKFNKFRLLISEQ